jgi:hypothetical protein
MTTRFARRWAGIVLGCLSASLHPVHAQEAPLVTPLSMDHADTSEGYPVTGFGHAVAIKGDTAFVGVPLFLTVDANDNVLSTGLVEVYAGDAGGATWTRTGSLLAPDPANESECGSALAVSDKRLAVGCRQAIQLFEKRRQQWVPLSSIPLGPADSRSPLSTLTYQDDTLAFTVYEQQNDAVPGSQTGYFVYLYRIGAAGQPHLVQKLMPVGADAGSFGSAIAIRDDLMVIGSPGGYGGANDSPPGQAYVFAHQGDHWSLTQRIQSPTGAVNSGFGAGVAIGHHSILIGAPQEDYVGDGEFTQASGELYVFRKSRGLWGEVQETRPDFNSGAAPFAALGSTIATGGGRVAIAAPSPTDVFGASFGPTVIYRWEGDMLVLDASVPNTLAASLDVSGRRIIIGQDTQTQYGFFNKAVVLTFPGP